MSKVIKNLGSPIIKQAPMEIETNMEDFIKGIEAAEEAGVFDEYIANNEEVAKNETSMRLLRLLEDCIDTYKEMYKRSSGGGYVGFDIKFTMFPIKEGEYMGGAKCEFIKHEFGKQKILAEKVFGFRSVDEMRQDNWGEILLVQIVAEWLGSAHVLSNIKDNVKHTDLTNEKMRQANLKKKKDGNN
jgi:hypothetical protein